MLASAYQQVELYCYSGTGNALRASQWIAARAEAAGARTSLVRIEAGVRVDEPVAEGRTLLGFLYSTHGFCAPWTVLKLLGRLPPRSGRAVEVFLLNTRGGVKAGPVFLPGLSGVALLLPLLMLALKGYRVVGTRPLDMPASWLQVHPGMRDPTAQAIAARRQVETQVFADALLAGRRAYHGFWTLPVDLAIATITPLYLLLGRFALAKLQVPSRACDGCGVCAQLCPTHAIRMERGRPYWTFDCESCMRCYSVCPQQAVQCSHPFLAAQIALMVLAGAPAERAAAWLGAQLPAPLGTLTYAVLAYAGALLAIYLAYRALHLLMRLRPTGFLLGYASFNRYWRRYLAPGIHVKDLRGKRPGS